MKSHASSMTHQLRITASKGERRVGTPDASMRAHMKEKSALINSSFLNDTQVSPTDDAWRPMFTFFSSGANICLLGAHVVVHLLFLFYVLDGCVFKTLSLKLNPSVEEKRRVRAYCRCMLIRPSRPMHLFNNALTSPFPFLKNGRVIKTRKGRGKEG